MNNEDLLDDLKHIQNSCTAHDKNKILNHPQFNDVIIPLYKWAKQLKVLNKQVNIELYISKDKDIVIKLHTQNKNNEILLPNTLKNVMLGNGKFIIQSLDTIYKIKENMPDILSALRSKRIILTHKQYIELEKMSLQRVDEILNNMEYNHKISADNLKTLWREDFTYDLDCPYRITMIMRNHLELLGIPIEYCVNEMQNLEHYEQRTRIGMVNIIENNIEYPDGNVKIYNIYAAFERLRECIINMIRFIEMQEAIKNT